jgi:hypothetical protein
MNEIVNATYVAHYFKLDFFGAIAAFSRCMKCAAAHKWRTAAAACGIAMQQRSENEEVKNLRFAAYLAT